MYDHSADAPSLTTSEVQRALNTCTSLIRHPRSLQRPIPGWRPPKIALHFARTDLIVTVIRRRISNHMWLQLSEGNIAPPSAPTLYLLSLAAGHPSAFTRLPTSLPIEPANNALAHGLLGQLPFLQEQVSWRFTPGQAIEIDRKQLRPIQPGITVRHFLVTDIDLNALGTPPHLSSSSAA